MFQKSRDCTLRAELRSILVDTRKIEEDSARSRVYRPQSYESFFKKKFLQRRLMKDINTSNANTFNRLKCFKKVETAPCEQSFVQSSLILGKSKKTLHAAGYTDHNLTKASSKKSSYNGG